MPTTRSARARTYLRTVAPWRKLAPNRDVRRHVQGVDLVLPWSHRLPDYARSAPAYGQNLVALASALQEGDEGPLCMLDVGANVGDSAAQVIAKTGARVLCVEADPYWARYLRLNLGEQVLATIVEALLVEADGSWGSSTPVRMGGTTHFVQDADTLGAFPSLSIGDLRAQNPDFEQLRLVKSDTDGFDAILVPAIASVWSDVGPVLFFEWDPPLSHQADAGDPDLAWSKLEALGYSHLAIWDNGGAPLGQLPIAEAAEQAKTLARGSHDLGYTFWDVAARREDDAVAARAFDALMPQPFAVAGHTARR